MLHLDGLADTADGLASGAGREQSLAVMKASDIGPAGVVALVLALLAQTAALTALLPSAAGTALASLAWVASRQVLAWACRAGVPAASSSGLGALVAGTVSRPLLATTAGLLLAAAAGLVVVPGLAWWHGPRSWPWWWRPPRSSYDGARRGWAGSPATCSEPRSSWHSRPASSPGSSCSSSWLGAENTAGCRAASTSCPTQVCLRADPGSVRGGTPTRSVPA